MFLNAANASLPTSAYGNRFLFTGQQWYAELGLYDLRNRFYSPDIGRFVQTDPIGFAGDATNLYRYGNNNPMNSVDPTGTTANNQPSKKPEQGGGGGGWGAGGSPYGGSYFGRTITFRTSASCGLPSAAGTAGPIAGPWVVASLFQIETEEVLPAESEEERVIVTGSFPTDHFDSANGILAGEATRAQLLASFGGFAEGGPSAIERAMALSVDTNAKFSSKSAREGKATGISHYGPGTEIGGWDPSNDAGTNAGENNKGDRLNEMTLAMNPAYGRDFGLQYGGGVFVGGQFIGLWLDTGPPYGRIDVYDPYNAAGTNWGGMVPGATPSSRSH